jgi:hypothetical protein
LRREQHCLEEPVVGLRRGHANASIANSANVSNGSVTARRHPQRRGSTALERALERSHRPFVERIAEILLQRLRRSVRSENQSVKSA